jgi:hypothetical protein
MKKYISIVLVAMLLALIPIVSAEASASASRSIEDSNLAAGDSTNVTVTIVNDVSQGLSVKETVPSGWTLTRISDDADAFQASTNTWAWFDVGAEVTKTVIYNLEVPSNAAPGDYNINGDIINQSGVIAGVTGDNLIEVTPTATPTVTLTATPTATPTSTTTETPPPTGVPEFPNSMALVAGIAGIMLVAFMLLVQNRKGK